MARERISHPRIDTTFVGCASRVGRVGRWTAGFVVLLGLFASVLLAFGACGGPKPRAPLPREEVPVRTAEPNARVVEMPAVGPLTISDVAPLGERPVVRVRAGSYVKSPRGDEPSDAPIVVRGAKRILIDLSDVELRGKPRGTPLDELTGYGLVLLECDDVVVRGGTFAGFKVCVGVQASHDVVLEDMSFDSWFGMRLSSTPTTEDPSDWLWPHDNDAGEWASRYGAAISLSGTDGARIERCRGRHGQNGILLTRCDGTRVTANDFSFLSGWGLALYRSTQSEVWCNAFDYCVRGYSHGQYWRGQDSAGILLFERSSDNVFVRNSATHGGDGVFLFAGRDLVDGRAVERGEKDVGGSDRNVFFENDFSFAVANAIEATFSSDNWLIGNRLVGSHQHGIWGGYSRRLVVARNDVARTLGGGITIEHGQDAAIVDNGIVGNEVGLELYWDEDPELVGGPFGRARDTTSSGHYVAGNRFEKNQKDFGIVRTTRLSFRDNQYAPAERPLVVSDTSATQFDAPEGSVIDPRTMLGARDRHGPTGKLDGCTIVEPPRDEPEWLVRARAFEPARRLLGPMPAHDGREGLDTIVMGEFGPWDFRSGEPRPVPRARGGLLALARWDAAWFRWTPRTERDAGTDPRTDLAAWRARAAEPVASGVVGLWTDPFGGSKDVENALGKTYFGLVARTTIQVDRPGRHRLLVTSDDGVRVRLDGAVVLENWTHHAPTRDAADVELSLGSHTLEIEYFQIDGAHALALELMSR